MYRFLVFLLVFARVVEVSASVEISGVFPNTVDDANLEWVELYNTGCEEVDISGYSISDFSGKKYIFPSGTQIASHATFRLDRSVSKIILNNDVETLYIQDTQSAQIEVFSYTKTVKGVAIYDTSIADMDCRTPIVPISSGSLETASGTIPPSTTNTGEISSSGVTTIPPETSSGIVNTGGVLSGSVSNLENTGTLISSSGSTGITIPTESFGTGLILESSGATNSGTSTETITGSTTVTMSGNSVSTSSGATGATMSGNNTGTSSLVSTGEVYTETGPLLPVSLYYSDADNNQRVDTIEIEYPYPLSGSVNTGAIALFSRTGGLSSMKIDTQTGFIISGNLSGNILILKIREGDIEKNILSINNTTNSDLRLKSSGNLGFTSRGGKVPDPFFLTTSFESYRKVYLKMAPTLTDTHTSSGTTDFLSGNITSQTGTIFASGSFPEILPTLQSPTNALFSGSIFYCDTKNLLCRVNLTLENIFTGTYLAKNFMCEVRTGTNSYDSCNPNTLYYTSSGTLEIILREKSTGIVESKIFPVVWYTTSVVVPQSTSAGYIGVNHVPVPILEYDGKWKTYFEQKSDTHLVCYTMTCSVNFTGEKSYDPDGDSIRFLWIYDYVVTKNTKDPGSYTFYPGFHTLILRVIDSAGAWSEIRYQIDVVEPKTKENIPSVVDAESVKLKPLEIILQTEKEGVYYKSGVYYCETSKSSCSLNFQLKNPLKGYTYEWWFPESSGSLVTANPRSYSFPPGRSVVQLYMKDHLGSRLTTQMLQIEVLSQKNILASKESLKKKKIYAVDFFDPPIILLQNIKSGVSRLGDDYRCHTKKKYCSLNFNIQNTEKGYTYEWWFPGSVEPYVSKNPRSLRFPLGKSDIQLVVKDSAGNQIWMTRFLAEVIKDSKSRKSTKSSGVSMKTSLLQKHSKITINNGFSYPSPESPIDFKGFIIVLLSFGILSSLVFRKKLNTLMIQ